MFDDSHSDNSSQSVTHRFGCLETPSEGPGFFYAIKGGSGVAPFGARYKSHRRPGPRRCRTPRQSVRHCFILGGRIARHPSGAAESREPAIARPCARVVSSLDLVPTKTTALEARGRMVGTGNHRRNPLRTLLFLLAVSAISGRSALLP